LLLPHVFVPNAEKISENEALLVNPALNRQHKVLTGSGRGLLAKGLQDFDLTGIQGSKAVKKLLQYSGLSKLNLVEVCLTVKGARAHEIGVKSTYLKI